MTDKLLIGRAVVQQALEAMLNFPDDISDEMFESIRALRAALAQQPEPAQEPVAWMVEGSLYASKEVAQKMGGNAYTLQALYTTPPQRQDQRVEKLEAQRDALKQTLHDELAGNLRLRDLGGARPDEPMLTFLERIIAERDALLEVLKQIEPILTRMYGPQAAELPPMQVVRAAIKKAEEGE